MKLFAAVGFIVICIVAVAPLSFSATVLEDRITQSISAPLRNLYSEAVVAFRNKDFPKSREKYEALLEEATKVGDKAGIGLALVGLGAVDQALQNYALALESFKQAPPYLASTGVLELEGWGYAALGEIHLQLSNPRDALDAYVKALAIGDILLAKASETEKLSILMVRVQVFDQMSQAHELLEEFDLAAKYSMLAARDFEQLGNKPGQAGELWKAGNLLLYKAKKPQLAIDSYAEATKLLEEIGETANALWTLLGLGWAQLGTKNFEEAKSTFLGVINTANQHSLRDFSLQARLGLAQTFDDSGEFGPALTHYQELLGQLDVPPNGLEISLGEIHWHMAEIYRLLSDYEKAFEHFVIAASKFREKDDPRQEAETWTGAAEVYAWLGGLKEASSYYKRALAIYRSQNDTVNQMRILSMLGQVTMDSNIDEAKDYFSESNKLLQSLTKDRETEFAIFRQRSEEIVKSGVEEQDIEFARRMKRQNNPSDYNSLDAFFHWQLRKSQELFKLWQASVPDLGADFLFAVGSGSQRLGIWQVNHGNPQQAMPLLTAAELYFTTLPIDRKVAKEWAVTCYFIGEANRRLKNPTVALSYFNLAFIIAEALRTPEIHWVYAAEGRTFADMHDYGNAISAYRTGLKILESIQNQPGTEETKIGIFQSSAYIYQDFTSLLLSLYEKTRDERYQEEAFEYTQKGKARVFLEMMSKTKASQRQGEAEGKTGNDRKIDFEIAKIHQRLREIKLGQDEEKQLLNRLDTLRHDQVQLQREKSDPASERLQKIWSTAATITQIQRVLPTDTVLFEYFTSPAGFTLWAITKDAVRSVELPDNNISTLLEQYLKTLKAPLIISAELKQHILLSEELYRLLIKPAEDKLRGKKTLLVAPDGPLYYLPFETLIVPKNSDRSKTSSLDAPGYLIKDVSISYIPSASVFLAKQEEGKDRSQRAQHPLLAFGDPVYKDIEPRDKPGEMTNTALRGLNLPRLEFSGEEVRRIAQIWEIPLSSEHINLRDRATLERLRKLDLSSYRMLHFATHAIAGDEVNALSQPALILSQLGRGDEETLLQFSDILELKLNADLVVLSACETGLGRLREGEGIIGLTRAFLYAGASSTVVSLWKAEDQSTSLLMEGFYQQLKKGVNKSQALRQAKLNLMQSTIQLKALGGSKQTLSAPFYWAPFILFGDSGRVLDN